MRGYIPNTREERQAMLEAIGLPNMEALFADVPANARLTRPLDLPGGMSELEVQRAFSAFTNPQAAALPLFRGAGAYRHFIPAVVDAVAGRSELYTAYTPYQAEMSQGMLQCIFEYQTLICELTGMDVSNASVYDGATACAELLTAFRGATRKSKVLVSAGLHSEYLATIRTYARFGGFTLVELPLNAEGLTDLDALKANLTDAAGMILQSPNFLGHIEDMQAAANSLHENKALLAACVNPLTLGLLEAPGALGADFCVGDGQPLGIPLGVGGPYVGFMSAKQKYVRALPGRIVGQTKDADGNRTFVLTLQAREQHIRREKAASNICSNQSLCAIRAAIYLAAMGPEGMQETAELCLQHAHYLRDGILAIPGMRARYPRTAFFHEFVVDCDKPAAAINAALREKGFVGGLALGRYYEGDNGILYCATECNTRDEIDRFLNALEVCAK